MTEPKFTLAPWEVSEPNGVGNGYRISGCEAWLGYNSHSKETKANAFLLKAAPEMYRELEKCAKFLRRYAQVNLEEGEHERAAYDTKFAENCERVLANARGDE